MRIISSILARPCRKGVLRSTSRCYAVFWSYPRSSRVWMWNLAWIHYWTFDSTEIRAPLPAPNRNSWLGRRDHVDRCADRVATFRNHNPPQSDIALGRVRTSAVKEKDRNSDAQLWLSRRYLSSGRGLRNMACPPLCTGCHPRCQRGRAYSWFRTTHSTAPLRRGSLVASIFMVRS